ncbi:MAG: leucine-rich repeat protein [Lachnospiraceae bacterium]|nr:leucine-rich repeat protein [Lachnospiraceae bacterium]
MKNRFKKLLAATLTAILVFSEAGSLPVVWAAEEAEEAEEIIEEDVIEEENGEEAFSEEYDDGENVKSEDVDKGDEEEETIEDSVNENETERCEEAVEAEEESVSEDSLIQDSVSDDTVSENEAENDDSIITNDKGKEEITRLQWWRMLIETFDMSVEQDNYPDNYFYDISSEDSFYRDVMIITEFGLMDVEAGDSALPEDAVTREYAAFSLNHCLGFMLDDDEQYTFDESATVSYPNDIQVSLDKGWFELSDGKFLPEETVTEDEMEKMESYAKDVLDSRVIDEEKEKTWDFADGVIDITSAKARMTDENEFTVSECSAKITAGKKYGFLVDGAPVVRKATSVKEENGEYVIATETVPAEEAFESIEWAARGQADLSQVVACKPDIEIEYIVGGDPDKDYEDGIVYDSMEDAGENEIEAIRIIDSYIIPDQVKKEFDLDDGIKAEIECTIGDMYIDYDADCVKVLFHNQMAYFIVSAPVTFRCNVSMDVLKAIGVKPNITLVKIPLLYGLGYLTVTLELQLEGNLSLNYVEWIHVGVSYSSRDGFSVVGDHTRESFTIDAHAKASAGVKAAAGFDMAVLKGEVYARIGATAEAEAHTYTDGQTPVSCAHIYAWMYLNAGYKVTFDYWMDKKNWGEQYDFIDRKNSPLKISQHFEDGKPVSRCSRDKSKNSSYNANATNGKIKYYTPITSRYSYSGASRGLDAKGEEYTIFETTKDEEKKTCTITKYNGNVSALNIPAELDGYKVVGIAANVFKGRSELRYVSIPDSVTTIGNEAFSGCKNLEVVELSKSLVSLGKSVFKNCTSLGSIEIPKSLQSCTENYGSLDYTSDGGAFEGCSNLSDITFEEGITKIPGHIFVGCSGIKQVTIPNTVTEIGVKAFSHTGLEKIIIPDSVTIIRNSAFGNCKNATEIILSKGLTTLGQGVFINDVGLTSILIPKSLQSCTENYESLDYTSDGGAFEGCTNLSSVSFEEGRTVIPAHLFVGCPGLKEVVIPDSITEIGYKAFAHSGITDIVFSSKLETISGAVFYGCKELHEVTLPDSVISMGAYVFANCSSLETVALPSGRVNLMAGTFQNCTSLKSIALPDGLKTIRENAFDGCSSLELIEVPSGVNTIESCAFRGCIAIQDITLNPNATMTIGNDAFRNCESLSKVTLSHMVTSLGNYCFENCAALETVTLGSGITAIPQYCFANDEALESIVLPYYVKTIGANAFLNDTKLKSITIPRSTTTIATTAFSYKDRLTIYGVSGTYAETFADTNGFTFVSQEINATDVTFEQETYTIYTNATLRLPYNITPANYTDEMTWSVSKGSDRISLTDGVVKGLKVTDADDPAVIKLAVGDKLASCKIIVLQSVTSISLSKTSVTLDAGGSIQLTCSVSPSTASDKTVSWTSSDESIATVDENGKVTAVNKGECIITVTALDGGGAKKECKVTVSNTASYPASAADMQSAHPYDKNSSDIWIYKKPGAANISVTFSEETKLEDDTEGDYILIKDAAGKQVGKYYGSELAGKTVTVTGNTFWLQLVTDGIDSKDYGFSVSNIEADVSIVEVTAISILPKECTISKGGSQKLTATLSPDNATDRSVSWTSSSPAVATVDANGESVTVTGKTAGKATITAKTSNGLTATATVTVTEDVAETCTVVFYADGQEIGRETVNSGDSVENVPTPPASEGEFKGWYVIESGMRWDPSSQVTKDMEVEARYSTSGEEEKSGLNPVIDIIDTDTLYGIKGQTIQLNKEIVWTSTNASVAAVNGNGMVTLKSAGSAHVKGNTFDYSIIVAEPSLSQTKLSLVSGDVGMISIKGLGNNASEYGITWASSNCGVADVDEGEVYTYSKGSAVITAYINGKAFNCKVTVADVAKVKDFSKSVTLKPLQSVKIKADGFKANTASWTSDNGMTVVKNAKGTKVLYYQDDVVRITQAGKLIAAGQGTTELTGVDKNGKQLRITVTVEEPTLNVLYMNNGGHKTIKHYGVKNKDGVWLVEDASVKSGITVDAKGYVTAKGCGTEWVDCFYDPYGTGGFVFTTMVIVESPYLEIDYRLTSVGKPTSGKYEISLSKGEDYEITHEYLDHTPIYKSNKPKVAYADENGVIHAVGTGTAKLSMKVNGKTIKITVKVS